MRRTPESQHLLRELELADMTVVLSGVESGELSLNGEFEIGEFEWELLRRLTAWNSRGQIGEKTDLKGPVGFVWTPDQLEELIEFGNNEARERLRAAGITDFQLDDNFDLLMGLLPEVAKRNDGPTIAYVYDEELPQLRQRKRELEVKGRYIETDLENHDIAKRDTIPQARPRHLNPFRDNPFRLLGVYANCTEKELVRQASKISSYAEVGKSVELDIDFPLFGNVARDGDSVKTASAKVEQPMKRLQCAMFWFVNANHIDETALGHLKSGNVQKALEIWSLAVKDKPITHKNYSSANNLSTLQLGYGTRDGDIEAPFFLRGIRLKGELIESEAFDCFVELVLGRDSLIQRERVGMDFADEVLHFVSPFLNAPNGISTTSLIGAFGTFSHEARGYLSGKFTAGPVHRIEAAIIETKAKRAADPHYYDGLDLFKAIAGDLATLKAVVGADGVQYQISLNKIAQEILQCSIDYFNELAPDYDFDDEDPGPGALWLIELVYRLEPTGEVKHRLDENAPIIREWVADKNDRDNQLRIKDDVTFIKDSLDGFQDIANNPTTALKLLETCRPKLDRIGFVLGQDDEFYRTLCDAVGGNAIGMTVSAVNSALDKIPPSVHDQWYYRIALLKNSLEESSRVMQLVTEIDLSPELRSRCEVNGRTLVEIMGQLGMSTAGIRWGSPNRSTFSSSPGYAPTKTRSTSTYRPSDNGPLSGYADNTNGSIPQGLFALALEHPFISFIICVFVIGTAFSWFSGNANTSVANTKIQGSPSPKVNTNVAGKNNPQLSPTPTPKVERPKSGAVLSSGSKRRGNGELKIANGTTNDALVKLIDVSADKTYREVYVRANSTVTIGGIAVGTYELLFTTGQDYAPSIKRFLRNSDYSKFDNQLSYQETRSSSGVGFRQYEVTLNKVAYGNAPTSTIDESAFDK